MLFKTGPVFQANYESTADVVINQGGTDSGKTYALVQLAFTICATTKAPKIDPVFTIVAESVPNLKKGAYRIAKAILDNTPGLRDYLSEKPNETDRILHFKTGWIMEFFSVVDEQGAKQGKRQYLYVNEAQGITYPIFWQLAKRTRIRTFIDYNPTAPFWAHEKLIGTNKSTNDLNAIVELLISDHRHNPFLTDKEHERTENIADPELWKVYARGKTGNVIGLVFTNWVSIPDKDFPWANDGVFYGADFGYTNDPTAIVAMVVRGRDLYIHELCYSPELTPKAMVVVLETKGKLKGDMPVYCEHDGNMIRQLRMEGVLAIAAKKGPGSINAGILKLKEYQVHYTESSTNLKDELARYMWLTDDDGKATNTPIDKYNHLLDATRYGVYSHFYRGEK